VAYSPDGAYIATASGDGTARLWNAASGEALESLTNHTNMVQGIAFSPKGDRLVTGGYDSRVKVWSLPVAKEWMAIVL